MIGSRFQAIDVGEAGGRTSFAQAFRQGMSERLDGSPRELPSRFFYDSEGSALFERITQLPEYYLTRLEHALLETSACEIIARAGARHLVEYGSGSSMKTRLLLEAAMAQLGSITYSPIDISREFLHETSQRLLTDYQNLDILAVHGEYEEAARARVPDKDGSLILFLGSNIGNLSHEDAIRFLSMNAKSMSQQDRMLVGIDRTKPISILEAAYNDSEGITAAFNRNVLARANRELGANFQVDTFEHEAPYLLQLGRIEMHLRATVAHQVRVEALDWEFRVEEGETIRTELCHKYSLEQFAEIAGLAGLTIEQVWSDPREWFSEVLLARYETGSCR